MSRPLGVDDNARAIGAQYFNSPVGLLRDEHGQTVSRADQFALCIVQDIAQNVLCDILMRLKMDAAAPVGSRFNSQPTQQRIAMLLYDPTIMRS